MQRNSKQPLMSDLNIVLLGKTGSGKSASGNTIIGVKEKFKVDFSPSSVTKICQQEQKELSGQTVTVIDTVGLPDTSMRNADVQTKIEQIFYCTNNGVDVFLLVIKLGDKFTEARDTVKWIKENFGEKVLKHTIVLFTLGDQLHESIENYLNKSLILKSEVDQCSGHCHVFNNKDGDQSQVTELLEKIDKLRKKNRNRRYTEQDYKETQDQILQGNCLKGAAVGGGVGGGVGALGGAIAAKVGVAALTVGKAAIIGATGGAVLAGAVAGFGVYLFARKYISKSETGGNKNKKRN